MSITLVAQATTGDLHANTGTTGLLTTLPGDLLVFAGEMVLGGQVSSVSGGGATWSGSPDDAQHNTSSPDRWVSIWSGMVTVGTTGAVTAIIGGVSYFRGTVFQLRCTSGVFILDTHNGNVGTGNPDSGSVTPTASANVAIISCVAAANGPGGGNPDIPPTGFSLAADVPLNGDIAAAIRLVTGASGSYSGQWTEPHNNWACSTAAYREVVSGGTSVTLGSVAAAGAVNAPTVRVDCTVTPSPATAAGAVHAPTALPSLSVALQSVAASAAVHAPSVRVDSSVVLGSVGGSGAVNAPAVRVDVTVVLGSVGGSGAVNAPTVTPSLSVALPSVAAAGAVHAPVVGIGVTLGSVAGNGAVNAPAVRSDASIVLGSVAGSGAVNGPSISAGGNASVTLPGVSAAGAVNTPTVLPSLSVVLPSVAAAGSANAPAARVDCAVVLGAAAGSGAANAPSVQAGGNASATLGSVAGAGSVNAPTVGISCVVVLGSAAAAAAAHAPTIRIDCLLVLGSVQATGQVHAPTAAGKVLRGFTIGALRLFPVLASAINLTPRLAGAWHLDTGDNP